MNGKLKLGELAEIVSGSTPKTNIKEYWDGDVLWITPAEIQEDDYYIADTQRKITNLAVERTNLKILPKGTVLLSSRAPIGKVAICDNNMYCNQGFKNIICSDRLENRYVYYFLKHNVEYIKSLGRGATFKEISKGIVENLEIPYRNKKEQIEIANKLDKIKEIINIRKKQIKKFDEIIKSHFSEVFGTPLVNEKNWIIKKTFEICLKITDGSHYSPIDIGQGYPMLSVKDMRNDGFHYENCKKVSSKDFDKLKNMDCVPKKNDLLISKDGSFFCYGFVVEKEKEEGVLSSIAILRPDVKKINPYYLRYYMLSEEIVNYVSINYVTGAALKRVILKGIKEIPVMLPPIELQNKFADSVKQIDKQKFKIEKSLKEMQELYESLMNKYFGE